MHERELLHTLFSKTLCFIHNKRRDALLDAVQALFIGKQLSLSHLGRNLQSTAKERNCIRKMDRLLGNHHLHAEIKSCYHANALMILDNVNQPIISVDWAATDKRKDWHILRASLNVKNRGLTLYQEVHPLENLNSTVTQNKFLTRLKSILPKGCKPIIVADAGFKFSWFKKIKQLGFDFVGRVRSKTGYKSSKSSDWHQDCLDMYRKATTTARHIGKYIFARAHEIECEVIIYKKSKKGRKHFNRSGNRTNNNASNRCARRQTDPWLLVTSLDSDEVNAKRVIEIYSMRMQIEEDFRDIKSHKYGFGLRYSLSNSAKRLEVLLLIASLACLTCWLVSLNAIKDDTHLDYQSNSIKHRNVLSVIFLGCQLIRRKVKFTFSEIKEAYYMLLEQIMEVSLC